MTEAQKGRSLSRECMLGRRGAGTARSTRGRATLQSAQTTWWSDQRVGIGEGVRVRVRALGAQDVNAVEAGGDSGVNTGEVVGEAAGEQAGTSRIGHAAQGFNASEAGEEGATGGAGGGAIVFVFDEVPVTG